MESLPKTLLYILFFIFIITTKKPSPLKLCWHRNLKTVVNQKSVNLGTTSARHTTKRQSFKKVICSFKETRQKKNSSTKLSLTPYFFIFIDIVIYAPPLVVENAKILKKSGDHLQPFLGPF